MSKKEFVFIATGDVGVQRENLDGMFDGVRQELAQADLLFGDCESPLSDRGTPLPQCRLPIRSTPKGADAIRRAGYDVMTFANNHCMDYGIDALADTLSNLKRVGIRQVGVGQNIDEARKPVIYELEDGTKVGFLAYCTVCPQNYWADDLHCGCAPMRAFTVAEPQEHDQPEAAVKLYSFPHPEDLELMLADIRALRPQVDILALSMHWGVHFTPGAVGWYQKYTAHFAIDAGADIIIGHHAHIMKPVEVYKGKAIFYTLPNFAFEGPQVYSPIPLSQRKEHAVIAARNPDTVKNPGKQMPSDSYNSCYLKCIIAEKKIRSVSLCPVKLDETDCRPTALHAGDPGFAELAAYLIGVSASEHYDTRFELCGDEIRVHTD